MTLTYLVSEKVVPYCNAMGVAKAAFEASERYLAADLGEGAITLHWAHKGTGCLGNP